MVRREAGRIQILTRNGYDWTARFPLMVAAAEAIKAKGFPIDGEAVVCDESGMAMFDHLRYRRHDANVFLYAFDLLSLNGHDLRGNQSRTASVVQAHPASARRHSLCGAPGVREGIVSKRLGSRYVSGRTRDWIKVKNPNAAAVKREVEEDWG